MRRCWIIALALAAVWLGGSLALPTSAAPAPPAKGWRAPFWTLPWGIASGDGATAYVVGQDGQVEALDLAAGKVRWTFPAGKPLALVGRRLAVQVPVKDKPNTLRLVLLDDRGNQLSQSEPVVFPEGVEVSGDGMTVATSAWSDGVTLYLVWRTGGRGGRGGRRQSSADGVAKVTLASGKVEMLESDKAPQPPAVKVSSELAREARPSVTSRGFGRGPGLTTRTVAVTGKHVVSVAVQRSGELREAVLRRWDLATEKALDPIVLTKAPSLTATLSADHRMVLVRVREIVADEEVAAAYRVYSTATGKEVGGFAEQDAMSMLTTLGERAYYVSTGPAAPTPAKGTSSAVRPRGLFAVDVKTGKLLWGHSIDGRRGFPREGGRRGGPRP